MCTKKYVNIVEGIIFMRKLGCKFKTFIKEVLSKVIQGDIFNTAIIVTYYVLLTVVPVIIFIGNILPLMHINAARIMPYLKVALPEPIYTFFGPIVQRFLMHGSGSIASFSMLFTLWAGSRGINALKRSMNQIFGVGDSQDFIATTVLSILITISFGALLVTVFVIYSFGQIVLEYLTPIFQLPLTYLEVFLKYRWSVTFIIIFIILCLIYIVLPNVKVHWLSVWPGALIASLGWMALTGIFTIYVKYFAYRVLSYGTLGTFLVLLFWMNFSNIIILLGAILNAFIEEHRYGKVIPKEHKFGHKIKKKVEQAQKQR